MAIGESLDVQKLLEKLERLPTPVKLGVLAGLALVVVVLYWFTLYGSQRTQLKGLEAQLTEVESQIAEAKAVASNLKSFQEEQERLHAELDAALRQLPNSSELPVLPTNINSLGKKSGLEIKTFRPMREIDRGFFAEVPIELEFFGAYHDVGVFFDRISRLSRIVNVTELDMKLDKYRGETPQLEISGIATTFKFVERDTVPTAGGGTR